MKISFENLGAIKKVDLDLSKKLILLCGPNGTGKTYVSYAVYGYFDVGVILTNIFPYKELISKKKIEVELDCNQLYKLKKVYIEALNKKIHSIFGLQEKTFFKKFTAQSLLTLSNFSEQVLAMNFDCVYSFGIERVKYIKKAGSSTMSISLDNSVEVNENEIELEGAFQNGQIGKYICNQSIVNSYILPVERNSVYTFADSLAVNKFKKANLIIEEKSNAVYPKPIQDALATAIDLRNIKKKTSLYASLADDIEQDILGGRISISDDGELLFSPKDSDNVNLPIHLSASIIKNLSGLLIYLRHQAKENDLLIIDEPELGLHPDNQVRLARIFARLINAGLRLMISTHSDYIIQELNNLIMLSSNKKAVKDVAEELGYKSDEFIQMNDIACYLFDIDKDNPSQVFVTSLPISDNGFEVDTIDTAICKLNRRIDDISYALHYTSDDN